jgi:hypothetical protein
MQHLLAADEWILEQIHQDLQRIREEKESKGERGRGSHVCPLEEEEGLVVVDRDGGGTHGQG